MLRFVFVLAGFLSAAALGELLGVESIVGSFFAGLALNRLVPNRGTLMQSIEFVGAALLVPLFLISVGMLVDPAVVADPGHGAPRRGRVGAHPDGEGGRRLADRPDLPVQPAQR